MCTQQSHGHAQTQSILVAPWAQVVTRALIAIYQIHLAILAPAISRTATMATPLSNVVIPLVQKRRYTPIKTMTFVVTLTWPAVTLYADIMWQRANGTNGRQTAQAKRAHIPKITKRPVA